MQNKKEKQEVRINEETLAPIDKVTIGIADNLLYQIGLLIVKRADRKNLSVEELRDLVFFHLSSYNDQHFSGVLDHSRLSVMTSAALMAAAKGQLNVGKNVNDGVITLNVSSTV